MSAKKKNQKQTDIAKKRSAAAKKGWETRRKNAQAKKRVAKEKERIVKARKQSLAQRKSLAERKIKKPSGKTEREKELERKMAELELELIQVKQKQVALELELLQTKKKAVEHIKKLRHKIKRIKKPYHVEVQERATADPEAFKRMVVNMVEDRMREGWGVYQAIADTWEEVNFIEGWEDMDDVRQAFAEEGETPEGYSISVM